MRVGQPRFVRQGGQMRIVVDACGQGIQGVHVVPGTSVVSKGNNQGSKGYFGHGVDPVSFIRQTVRVIHE